MKIGLLLPANRFFCPYADIYTKIFDELGTDYQVICWDKVGLEEKADFVYHKKLSGNSFFFKKLLGYYLYSKFIAKQVKMQKYDKLIVFGPQIALFSFSLLLKRYKGSFVLDYRDLSIEQKFKKKYLKLLENSELNIISSPGFKKCLPNSVTYLLCHNMNIANIDSFLHASLEELIFFHDKIVVLTIGAIRDCEQNIELINALSNNPDFDLQFVGKSDFSDVIKDYAMRNKISNASFTGFYEKEKEGDFIKQCNFMNIYYPRKLSHDTALSNRFYNALLFCKPMIVTKNTIQGDLVEEYNLGLSIDNCCNLSSKINDYIANFDKEKFVKGRNALLNHLIQEQTVFHNTLVSAFK